MGASATLDTPVSDVTTTGVAVPAGGQPRLAALIAALAWSLALVSVAALLVARPPVSQDLWFFVVDVTVACVYGTVAALTLSRRLHPVPWVLALTAVGGGLAALGFAYAVLGARYPDLPYLAGISRFNGICWVPGTLALFLVIPWLVRDHPLGRAWFGLLAGVGVAGAWTTARIAAWDAGEDALVIAASCLGLVTAAAVALRHRCGPPVERVGLGWLAIGTAVMAASFVPLALPDDLLPLWTLPSLHLVAQAFFPAAILVAVLRQRMWGLDLAISRAVLAGVLTLALVLLYVAVAAGVPHLIPGSQTAQLIAAAVVVTAVQPSRLWLQRRVHRLVYGDAADPDRAIRTVGRQLSRAGSAEELLDGLVHSVVATLRLESATVVADGTAVAAAGTPSSPPVSVPLLHRGEPIATLEVTAPPGEALGARTHRSLAELATVVAAGVALAAASSEIEQARDRLTRARLEERRLIRRELHDGLGPALAGLRLGLQGARNLVLHQPAAAAELLTALQDELDLRVEDVRSLSRQLLPPILDELGLAAALDELVRRTARPGFAVRLRRVDGRALPAPLAAAVYGIAAEALTNAARHSGARRCDIDVVIRADAAAGTGRETVILTVQDDGTGLADDRPVGVGTRSMIERAEEQGGTVEFASADPRGTRVLARLPLSAGPS